MGNELKKEIEEYVDDWHWDEESEKYINEIKKEKRWLTGGHKTLGVKCLGEYSVSHQAFFSVDRDVTPNSPNDFIPPSVMWH